MSKGYIVDADGVPGFFGHQGDSKAVALQALGHTFVGAENVRGDEISAWDGDAWVPHQPLIDAAAALAKAQAIAATDGGMARIAEDLIDVLIAKGTIALTDLPIEAQAKLVARKALRT